SEQPTYVPIEYITLNCGVVDKSSIFGPFESSHNKSQAQEADGRGFTVERVPHMTTRVSSSDFKDFFLLVLARNSFASAFIPLPIMNLRDPMPFSLSELALSLY
ncbi:hypothetical protein V6Z11_A07G210500, partial [Gossypium hirsutum]